MKLNDRFTAKTAVIVCHDSMPGPPHETLRDFLLKGKIERLLFIGHVNQYVKDNPIKSSYLKLFVNGKLVKTVFSPVINIGEPWIYFRDVILTLYWVLKYKNGHVDIYFGLANINASMGLMLRWFGVVTSVVYYVIDYVPNRFANAFINSLYHYLDKICCLYATSTWNYGKGMIDAREKKWGRTFPRQQHTPHGVDTHSIVLRQSKKYERTELVYLGTLFEQQGLQLIIRALPHIKKHIPTIHLTVIGIGPYRDNLEMLIKQLNIGSVVEFKGFIKSVRAVDLLLAKSSLGLATYKNDIGFVMYTEPGKVKRYLSCGIPVVITKNTPLSEEVVTNLCGISCEYNEDDVSHKIIDILTQPKKLSMFRRNAIRYASQYSWQKIYTQALLKTL